MSTHPITLTVSPGRSGTSYLYHTLRQSCAGTGAAIHHELLSHEITKPAVFHRPYDSKTKMEILASGAIRALLNTWKSHAISAPVVDFGWTMRSLIPPFYDELGSQLRVLVLHRHPVAVAASLAVMGMYSRWKNRWSHLTPDHPNALFPQFRDRWSQMSSFEKCLYLWLEVTAFGVEVGEMFPAIMYRMQACDGLFGSNATTEGIASFCGLSPSAPLKSSDETNSLTKFALETNPLGREWANYLRHPELIEFSEQLGYNMEMEYVRSLIAKYLLPKNFFSVLRHKTGFWNVKARAGKVMRQLGLKK